DTMFAKSTNLLQSIVVEQNPGFTSNHSFSGEAKILSYEANRIRVQTRSQSNSILVLTDSFYPGWKAFIDGKEVSIIRTDFAFRGVSVPKGNHIVQFQYMPRSFVLGIYIAVVGVMLLLFEFFPKKKIF
ncbi:MAG: YfhO family protein, partial [Candidatus Levyibacteriota bacterium]